jgi:S1-C subfamily serine protease
MRPSRSTLPVLLLAAAAVHADPGPALSSVSIEVRRDAGVSFNGYRLPREAEGMGVVIAQAREIATAAHVVWQARSITVTDIKGATSSARIVCIDKAVDVALLRVEHPFEHAASIRAKPAVTGEMAVVVDRTEPDEAPRITAGPIASARWTSNGVAVPLIFPGLKGEKGMSGGGLFDTKGEVVGIVVRIDSIVGYLSALPVSELCTRFSRCAGGVQPGAAPPAACAPVEGDARAPSPAPAGRRL